MTPAPDAAGIPAPHHPMSFEQESIWLNDQFQEGTSRYLESWAHRLRGARVDADAVQRALTGIVARHEALRSRLALVEGEPRQTVMPPPDRVDLDVRWVRPRELRAAAVAAATRPVALDRPPLLRASLLRLAEDDAVLVVAVHHAVIDGWSFSLLDAEFSTRYRAALAGTEPRIPALPLQFGPYARERRRAYEGTRAQSLAYWREVLRDAPAESALPTDRPRPAVLGTGGDRIGFTLDAGIGAGVRDLARRTRSTPFSVLAAALAALVSRLSGQDDVVIGTPVSRRDEEVLEPMIACLADVLPLRLRAPAGISFAELAVRAKEQVWGAVRHRGIPHSHLVRALGTERTPGRFPLFQVVFGLDDAPEPALDLPGITAERLYLHAGTSKYDVFLRLVPEGGGFRGFLEFSTDLFDRATARRLAERLRTLLADATARPGRPVRELDVLPAGERRLLLGTWSRGPSADGPQPLAHEAFAARARRTPGVPAVVHGDRTLTYAELDRAADAVAAYLMARGAAGAPVGVCLPRGPELAVAVLGVLKAGSGCVPLDPALPADRIARMAGGSGIRVALVRPESSRLLPPGVETVSPDAVPAAPGARPPVVTPEDLAYLVHTSGSTGLPKGVAVPHRSLACLLAWQRARSLAGPGTRTLQFASPGFDVAFQELFSTWASGGTLVVADEESRRDPARLLDLLASERIERLFLPFVALQQLADYACATGRPATTLREVVTAGEQLHATPALREFFRSLAPHAVLENQYGPSETHVVTAERLGPDPAAWPDLPPIGRPVPGARVLLLDGRQRLCPAGTVGEICVGGRAVASGYPGDPELTARKFVPDPFRPAGVLYRTGDMARYLPDGRIQFLGRRDDQVKVRGHRVEPGEVAAAVRAVPGVADAVVVARTDGPAGGTRLIAYYLPGAGDVPQPDALRRAAAQRLPDHMVPAVCVRLERFPLTASGKLDRAALPPPGAGGADDAEPSRPFLAPRTPTERRIAEVWQDLLGGVRVGVHDDFFGLGGHSLLATRLVLRLHEELGVRIPLGALALTPTVAGLAELADRDTGGPVFDPRADTELPADIVAAAATVRVAADPAHVLVTGATGFLGAFTVRALLDRTRARVHCLVRGPDRARAAARLRSVMEDYGIWDEACARRIRVVPGDLAAPRLGLSGSAFDELARTVDSVYHVGAAVNLVSPYRQLKAATVDGTARILRLAARHRSVPVHHVSTVGVFAGPSDLPLGPEHPTGPLGALEHGYTRSKWVAERLVDAARARSLPVTVHRPTRISAHSRTGACQTRDYMWLLLKGCVQAEAAPAGVDTAFDLVPVDYVADSVVELSLRPGAAGRTFHLAAGRLLRLDTAVQRLRARGYRLADVEPQEWMRRIGGDPDNAAFPLLGTLAAELTGGGSEGSLRIDGSAADAALAGAGVVLPQDDTAAFALCLDRFVRTRWLPEPPAGPGSTGAGPGCAGHGPDLR
ncbi:amino acid adenylation domain-containing protein [Streptomyces sp. NPDC058646]|uniref:non-ribosomal peptide synthetase n=1 Tax=Streptomyces sp. NPDC058646 TaxID=3346574 RepID=UPI003668A640